MPRGLTILTWNVVSMRNMLDKSNLAPPGQPPLSFLSWLEKTAPDIICFQETKLQENQLPAALQSPHGYHTTWNFADRKGYSGVATFSQEKPLKIERGIGSENFDREGRVLMTEFPDFILFNVYFPKAYSPREVETARKEGAANAEIMASRLPFKLAFYDAIIEHIDRYKAQGKNIVLCGDFNTAHREIDLARPKANKDTSGFLPEERALIDKLVSHGYIDTFRHLHPDARQYTWWSYRFRAREKDIGWRLDYFFISESLLPALASAFILKDVYGSDHCPDGLTLKIG